MQRWHLTVGLASLALVAAIVAPRLIGNGTASAAPVAPPAVPPAPVSVAEAVPEIATPTAPAHVTVTAGLDRTAVAAGTSSERYLVVDVTAVAQVGERAPVDLAVVIDTSGSMRKQGKIQMARAAASRLASALSPGDELAMVGFSDRAYTFVLPQAANLNGVDDALAALHVGGETNLAAGIQRGGDEVFAGVSEGVKRVVIVSDGYPTVGDTSGDGLAEQIAALRARGVAVSTIGLGVDFDEDLLARLSGSGGGSYAFADDPNALESAFRRELERTATLVARDTRVHVELPAGVELVEFVGRTATREGTGWNVDVGSLSAGESRKVVARVRIEAGAPGSTAVAAVSASWDDRLDGTSGAARVDVATDVTPEVAAAEKSYDRDNNIAANEARSGWFMDQAARAFARGDAGEATEIARHAQVELQAPMAATPSPALDAVNDKLGAQGQRYADTPPMAKPSEARRMVIEAKVDAMDAYQ
jgi:Ca-activated chloride channel family protein